MSKICLLLSVVFLIQVSRACDENNNEQLAERRDSIEYLANAYGFAPNQWDPYYYQSNARVPGINLISVKKIVEFTKKNEQIEIGRLHQFVRRTSCSQTTV